MRATTALAGVLLAAVSITSNAFDVDDVERFNYVNNVSDPSPWVWGPGYLDLLPSVIAYGLHPLPLPAQAVLYRVAALAAAVMLFRELQRLFDAWRAPRADAAVTAGALACALHLVEPELLGNLSWVNWSLLLAAVARLLATSRYAMLPPPAAAAVTIALLTTPAGVIAAPLLLAGGLACGGPGAARVIAAATVLSWHGVQAITWPGEWTPQAASIWTEIADQYAAGTWRITMLIGAAALVAVSVALGVAARARLRVIEAAMLCYMAWASMAAFVLSTRLTDQGFEPRYILTPAYCALLAILGVAWQLRPGGRRATIGLFVAVTAAMTLVNVHVDRRGPIVLWLQRIQFAGDAAGFRRHCAPGTAVAFEDEPSAMVIECRPQPRAPGTYPIPGAQPAKGSYQPDAPLAERPSLVVPPPVF